jgi:hypothetical protein
MAGQWIQVVGGPLDGWPLLIRGELPDELQLPYSREMLELAGASGTFSRDELRERWGRMTFPSEDEALGVAVYVRDGQSEPPRYVFTRRHTS